MTPIQTPAAPVMYPRTAQDVMVDFADGFKDDLATEGNIVGRARHEPSMLGGEAVSLTVEPHYIGTEADREAERRSAESPLWKKLGIREEDR